MRAAARALTVLSVLLTGCAHAALQYGRDGLMPVDHAVRVRLAAGQFGSAYDAALGREARTRDRLLRALSVGALGLYANRTDSSVWALDRAWTLTEDRWSKRLSAGAAAVVVNDYLMPYTPGRTERLFIPFYGALSWLARHDAEDAAVEARRLTLLLGQADADSAGDADADVRGVMHYVAGAVFEAAGDRSAAEVAYRNAARRLTVPVVRDTTAPDSLSGDVVVVVEQGFVGHPVPHDATVWVSRGEYDGLRRLDRERSHGPPDGDARIVRAVGVREGARVLDAGFFGPGYGPRFVTPVGLSLNWAEFRDGRAGAGMLEIAAAGASQEVRGGGNVSRAVHADFERGQPARFARALLRAAGRATLYKAAGDQLAKAGSDLNDDGNGRDRPHGRRAGAGNNARLPAGDPPATGDTPDDRTRTAAAVGRALLGLGLFAAAAASDVNDVPDLRSWNLLPHDVRVVRLRLPAGEREVQAVIDGRPVSVGRVLVRPGGVTVLSYRSFGDAR